MNYPYDYNMNSYHSPVYESVLKKEYAFSRAVVKSKNLAESGGLF
jgi:hypothetical protein